MISTDRMRTAIHKLASILEKALGKEMVLPASKISTVEELLEVFPNVRDLLIDDAKAWNRIISGFRVLVEHAIGGVKRFGIVSDKFRNKSINLEIFYVPFHIF